MITSTTFSIIFLLVVVIKASSMNLTSTKKILKKPLHDSLLAENQNAVPKMTISIYYESMCSDCVSFFTNQIGPNLEKFQKYVNFDFVPSGNTETKLFDGRWFFKCKNGLNECMKNKWQACSIHILPSKLQILSHYLVCYMMNPINEMQSGYQCTRNLGLYEGYYSKIKKCYMNREFSDTLMIQHNNRTRSIIPKSTQMPTVVFNGVYNETEQSEAKSNLSSVLCKHLHPKPVEVC